MTRETPDSLLLTAAAVAETLGVSRTTVWRLVKSGELSAPVKVRGTTRFRRADIEAYVAGLTEDGTRRDPKMRVL